MAMALNLLFAAIICFLLVKITNWWDNRKDRKNLMVASEQPQIKNIVEQETNMEKIIGTRDLFMEVLTKIGCQYQLGEGDDSRIFFAFQGENMFADASNESLYVVVWDTYWEHVECYMTLMRCQECVKPLTTLTLIPQLPRYILLIQMEAAWMYTAGQCLHSCHRCRLLRTIKRQN